MLALQPISKAITSKAALSGGNMLGQTPAQGDLICNLPPPPGFCQKRTQISTTSFPYPSNPLYQGTITAFLGHRLPTTQPSTAAPRISSPAPRITLSYRVNIILFSTPTTRSRRRTPWLVMGAETWLLCALWRGNMTPRKFFRSWCRADGNCIGRKGFVAEDVGECWGECVGLLCVVRANCDMPHKLIYKTNVL